MRHQLRERERERFTQSERERFIQGTGPFCYDIIICLLFNAGVNNSVGPQRGGPTAPSRSNRSRKIAVMRVNYNRLIYRKRKRQKQMQKKRNNKREYKKKIIVRNFRQAQQMFSDFLREYTKGNCDGINASTFPFKSDHTASRENFGVDLHLRNAIVALSSSLYARPTSGSYSQLFIVFTVCIVFMSRGSLVRYIHTFQSAVVVVLASFAY